MAFDPYAPGAIVELTDHGRLDASAPDFADRLAAKLERRGYEPHIARALGKKAAAEHDALRDLEEALDELDAAGKWGAEQVNGLGGRRRRPPSDRLLDAATARLRRANYGRWHCFAKPGLGSEQQGRWQPTAGLDAGLPPAASAA